MQSQLPFVPSARAIRRGSTWLRPVPDQPGLWASSHGCIWSSRSGKWRKLKPSLQGGRTWDSRGGYLRHTTRDPLNWKRCMPIYVHRAVCLAWHGYPPEDGEVYEVDHWDDNHLNNRPENLRWLEKGKNLMKRNGMAREEDWEGVL